MAEDAALDLITFDGFLTHWAKERPEVVALEEGDRQTTYAQVDVVTRQLVAFLKETGVGKGDRVAWYGKNSDRYFLLFYAAARVGAVIAPVGWRLAPAEISYILSDTGAKLVVAEEEFLDIAVEVAKAMDNGPVVAEASLAFLKASQMEPATFEPVDPHATILQLYTSGTTGNPKGVELSNANLFSLRKAGKESELPWHQYGVEDCVLAVMPCAHIGGSGAGPIAVSSGMRMLVQAEFTPVGVLEAIEGGASLLFLVPAAIQMVIQHPRAAETDFSHLRYLMYGAAPMPLELLKAAVRTMPDTGFLQVYGLTETTGTVSLLPPEDHTLEGNERMRSAGKAVPGVEIEIRTDDNKPAPLGEIGEVCIKSPSNMRGYWKRPDATAEAVDEDGWFHSGDAGIMDADGYVYIQDRIKDMIISGGENVYPAEVENAIFGHPAVAEVAVIGVPSQQWGEEVKACIVCKPGAELDEGELIAYTRERIAPYKTPKSVDVIPEMPRNATGKILRRELRDPYWEGQDRQVS